MKIPPITTLALALAVGYALLMVIGKAPKPF